MQTLFILLSIDEWTAFFGRFHPLFVHFPIGFLLLFLILKGMQSAGKIIVDAEVVKAILLVTAISATLSCAVGYFLSLEGDYDEDRVTNHQWQGIWFATLAGYFGSVKTTG